jgi:hypothetical protein
MPLEFESLSHGRIVFGFFNIETDLLLLNRYFFFAGDFCQHISRAAGKTDQIYETAWEVCRIEQGNIGNLMGAIHGIEHSGLIGEVYQLFPFPKRREDFKQNSKGDQTRPTIEALIQQYGKRIRLPFVIDRKANHIAIGEYIFSATSFRELIEYVWSGGLPRWKDRIRPGYVQAMKEAIEKSGHPLFSGLLLNE